MTRSNAFRGSTQSVVAWGVVALALHAGVLWALPARVAAPTAAQPLVVEVLVPAPPAPSPEAAPARASERLPAHAQAKPKAPRATRPLVAASSQPAPEVDAPLAPEVDTPSVAADVVAEGPPAVAAPAAPAPTEVERPEGGWGTYHAGLLSRVHRARRYPAQARRLGITGTATVEFCVGRDGRLTCAPTVTRSAHPLLDAAAAQLVELSAPFAPFPGHRREGEMRFAVDVHYALDAQ